MVYFQEMLKNATQGGDPAWNKSEKVVKGVISCHKESDFIL